MIYSWLVVFVLFVEIAQCLPPLRPVRVHPQFQIQESVPPSHDQLAPSAPSLSDGLDVHHTDMTQTTVSWQIQEDPVPERKISKRRKGLFLASMAFVFYIVIKRCVIDNGEPDLDPTVFTPSPSLPFTPTPAPSYPSFRLPKWLLDGKAPPQATRDPPYHRNWNPPVSFVGDIPISDRPEIACYDLDTSKHGTFDANFYDGDVDVHSWNFDTDPWTDKRSLRDMEDGASNSDGMQTPSQHPHPIFENLGMPIVSVVKSIRFKNLDVSRFLLKPRTVTTDSCKLLTVVEPSLFDGAGIRNVKKAKRFIAGILNRVTEYYDSFAGIVLDATHVLMIDKDMDIYAGNDRLEFFNRMTKDLVPPDGGTYCVRHLLFANAFKSSDKADGQKSTLGAAFMCSNPANKNGLNEWNQYHRNAPPAAGITNAQFAIESDGKCADQMVAQVMTHEIGHNFGARHTEKTYCDLPNGNEDIMASTYQRKGEKTFTYCAVNQMRYHINTGQCLG